MELQQAVEGLPVTVVSGADVSVREVGVMGVCHDSRRVRAGDLFVAWQGEAFDGRGYAAQAVAQGAVAVLASPGGDPCSGAPWLETEDPRRLMGTIASRVYGHPDRALRLVGITGTNGKTTVSYLVQAILEAAGLPTGVMGTLGYHFGDQTFPGERTTPEASDFYRFLRAMIDAGAEAVAVEVCSHALVQGRVEGARFEVAVFTNLTRDHLDFHGDMESYFEAKCRLFEQLTDDGIAVVNADDDRGRELAKLLPRVLTFSSEGDPESADVAVTQAALSAAGTELEIKTPRGSLELKTRLRGTYNVSNTCAAVAVAEAMQIDQAAIVGAFADVAPVEGRLDPIDCGQPFPVFLDYAHTPGGLEAALRSVRALVDGEIVLVFGCGGDKDQGKRPQMGRVAGDLAEFPILTDDNPRGEAPEKIHREVIAGLEDSGCTGYRVIGDRREAIRAALQQAQDQPGSVVLVAGKGHEREQIVGNVVRAFSDADEIRAALAELTGDQTIDAAARGASSHGGRDGAVEDA